MDIIYQLTLLLSLLTAYVHYADGLIGLRPPNQTPPKDKKNANQKGPTTSPRPTQVHSPHDVLSPVHNITIFGEESRNTDSHANTYSSQCHTLPLLRCSYKLLSQSLQNDSYICRQVQEFSQCSKSSIRESRRRDFGIGIGIVEDFSNIIYNEHSCHNSSACTSSDHKRHHRAKRQGSECCVDGILNCAVEVFFKMTQNRQQRCPLVDFYELCLQEANTRCQLNTLKTLSPVFTMQLKRKCKTVKVRRRRDLPR